MQFACATIGGIRINISFFLLSQSPHYLTDITGIIKFFDLGYFPSEAGSKRNSGRKCFAYIGGAF